MIVGGAAAVFFHPIRLSGDCSPVQGLEESQVWIRQDDYDDKPHPIEKDNARDNVYAHPERSGQYQPLVVPQSAGNSHPRKDHAAASPNQAKDEHGRLGVFGNELVVIVGLLHVVYLSKQTDRKVWLSRQDQDESTDGQKTVDPVHNQRGPAQIAADTAAEMGDPFEIDRFFDGISINHAP